MTGAYVLFGLAIIVIGYSGAVILGAVAIDHGWLNEESNGLRFAKTGILALGVLVMIRGFTKKRE